MGTIARAGVYIVCRRWWMGSGYVRQKGRGVQDAVRVSLVAAGLQCTGDLSNTLVMVGDYLVEVLRRRVEKGGGGMILDIVGGVCGIAALVIMVWLMTEGGVK